VTQSQLSLWRAEKGRESSVSAALANAGGPDRAAVLGSAAMSQDKGRTALASLAAGPWPLIGILLVQALLSLRLVWSNTAHQDEALYIWAGRLEWAHWLHGGSVPDFPAYFSGAPVVYPPLAAAADNFGGLAAARLMSLSFMLAATALLYAVTGRLFGRTSAVAGSAAFATLGSVQFLGAFATFDALTMVFLALASWLAIRSGGRRGEAWLAGCAVALALADAAKYAGLLWSPVVIALAVLGTGGSWRQALWRGVRLTVYTTALIVPVLFFAGGHSYLLGIMATTLSRPASTAPVLKVLGTGIEWIGGVTLVAAIGAAFLTRRSVTRLTALAWVLVAAAVLAPADQARIRTDFSLFKHVGYGAWFACIVAGYGLVAIARYFAVGRDTRSNGLSVALVILFAVIGVDLSGAGFRAWPDSSRMISDIAPLIERTGCPCLVAESDVVHYYLMRQTADKTLTTIFVFNYMDDGRALTGLPAYRAAIRNHSFRLVEMDPSELPAMYAPVVQALSAAHYRLVAATPSNVPGEPFEIWVPDGA
jgi:4-amino-4-deoxy-L-arabinose transferase-like glycosyltransferase